jgi:hypothetical protein
MYKMAQYHFDMPDGWIGAPSPPPVLGVRMRPSAPHGARTRASILLREPVPAQGSLHDALSRLVSEGTDGAILIKQAPAISFRSVAFPGLLTAVRLRPPPGPQSPNDPNDPANTPDAPDTPTPKDPSAGCDEGRIFAVLDAGIDHIPVIFTGGPDALPLHKEALDRVLTSLRPYLGGGDSPFSAWSL